ncbi:MAG: hypothetical protein KGR68_15200 [Betaproteobacteria bacterium]|nr:hypothetical protein [Betaproteobacteria bacterium]
MSACPECQALKTTVYETRTVACGWTLRRRRCGCGFKWRTFELADWELDLSGKDPSELQQVSRVQQETEDAAPQSI